jgi:hypothetical protein
LHPTLDKIGLFNQSKFGKAGYDGARIVNQLTE